MKLKHITYFNEWDILNKYKKDIFKTNYYFEVSKNQDFEINKPIDFMLFEFGTIKRSFCKCGYVSGNLNFTSCPKCNNTNGITIKLKNSKIQNLITKHFVENDGSTIYLKENRINIGVISDELVLKDYGDEIIYEVNNFSINCYSKTNAYLWQDTNFFKEYNKNGWDYKDYKYYGDANNVEEFFKYIECYHEFPNIIKDISKYPNLIKFMIDNTLKNYNLSVKDAKLFKSIKNIEDYILTNICSKKELLPFIDKLFNNDMFFYRNYFSFDNYNFFENYNNLLTNEVKDSIDYAIIHGDFKVRTINEIIDTVYNFHDKEKEILFSNYLKDNYIIYGNTILNCFAEDLEFLIKNKEKVCTENLERRNLNILKNKYFMIEKAGYNEKKFNLFMDYFAENPLDSLKYLDSRRAPNKQMKEEYLKKFD